MRGTSIIDSSLTMYNRTGKLGTKGSKFIRQGMVTEYDRDYRKMTFHRKYDFILYITVFLILN